MAIGTTVFTRPPGVLERAREEATRRGVPALVLTFEPHPRKLFRPEMTLFVLTPPPMKARLLSHLGFAALVEQPFTRDFAALSAAAFVTGVLEKNLGITHAVTGFDFHFGKDRQGGPAYLMAAGERHGFGVTLVDAFATRAPKWCRRAASARCCAKAPWPRPPACSATALPSRRGDPRPAAC